MAISTTLMARWGHLSDGRCNGASRGRGQVGFRHLASRSGPTVWCLAALPEGRAFAGALAGVALNESPRSEFLVLSAGHWCP